MIAKKITGGLLAATIALGTGVLLNNSAYATETDTASPIACGAIADNHENISTYDVSYPHGGTGNMEPPCGADVEMSTPISSTIPVGIIPRF